MCRSVFIFIGVYIQHGITYGDIYRDNVLPAQTIGTVINVNLIDGKDTIDKVKDITDNAIDKLIEE